MRISIPQFFSVMLRSKKVGNPKMKENVFSCFLIVIKALFKRYKDANQNLFSIKSAVPKKIIIDA
jgi:hypothetical protein